MITVALTTTGTVLAMGVLLLMSVSSVLPDIWERDRGTETAPRESLQKAAPATSPTHAARA